MKDRPSYFHLSFALLGLSILLISPNIFGQEDLGQSALVVVHDAPIFKERFEGELSISPQLGDLQEYLQVDLLIQSNCPSDQVEQIYPELAYDFNLLTASFLMAEMEALSTWLSQFGKKQNSCQKSLESIWENCHQQTGDSFWSKSNRIYKKMREGRQILELDRKIKEEKLDGLESTPWGKRWIKNGQELNKNLVNLFQKSESQCQLNFQQMKKICSHQYSVYGLSQLPWAEEELANFYMNLGESKNTSRSCLARYVWDNKNFEQIPVELIELLKNWSAQLANDRFPLGPLMGLKAIIELENRGKVQFEQVKQEVPQAYVSLKQLDHPSPSPVKTALPQVTPPVVIALATATPLPRVSAFDSAYLVFIQKMKKEEVKVSAQEFRADYPDLTKKAALLEEYLAPYQGHEALRQLKQEEGVGTQQAPMVLSFLKFFIDRQRHKVLFNIQSILGEEFFVENDFAKNAYVVKVRLAFERINGWTLTILP